MLNRGARQPTAEDWFPPAAQETLIWTALHGMQAVWVIARWLC